MQMKEEELLRTHQIGDVIAIIQSTTHHLFDPDELLTVRKPIHMFIILQILIYRLFLLMGFKVQTCLYTGCI